MKNVSRHGTALLFAILAAFIGLESGYAQQQYNDSSEFTVRASEDGRSVIITGYRAKSKDVAIPPTINNLPVSGIGENAFYRKRLTSVDIPNSVASIEKYAFSRNNLKSVVIPNSVTEMGSWAFEQNKLTHVAISNSLAVIPMAAFRRNKLADIAIPNSVIEIGPYAFMKNKFKSVTIPNNVESIKYAAFFENNITQITIGSNVEMQDDGTKSRFDTFYFANGYKAGTYNRRLSRWNFE